MMPALVAAVAGFRHVLGRARRPLAAPADPWATFVRGRVLDGRRDALGAFRCYMVAAQGGLPVGATLVWLAYRIGGGVHADPIAARAWARQSLSQNPLVGQLCHPTAHPKIDKYHADL